MKILVTGGAGYIGSHTCVELLNKDYEIIVVDNFSNSKMESLNRVKEITNKDFKIYNVDMCDYENFEKIFINEKIDGVIHFAGLKAVGESVSIPLKYYQNNLISTLNLIEFMKKYNVNNLVFSSSATVYGDPEIIPIPETAKLNATNPYGRTKLMIEEILRDFCVANKDFNVALLRYFNPIGAHKSGKIGEDPNGIPNNLLPYISQVAVGKLKKLRVFGNDYDTVDGTGVRDYIHVVDLALGHIKAIEKLLTNPGLVTYNLGTGNGTSVLEMIKAFEKASGVKINYEIVDRRPGDIASCYADPTKAKSELNWEAKYNIDDMCIDTWNWQKNNPNGYN
ncbi:MAG: UDP-glucose 4-epimerase [Fusobacteriaceae bacterium]|jgi:UDP-glucose 4-epimerase|nr:UDP-galactose 4-epimerase [Fusobacteriales bacterium]MDN5304862.1 UDP-glucose 4-epimerase [Fusobacteriaceae bacterium]